MQVLVVLVVLAALALADSAPTEAVADPLTRLAGALLALSAPVAFAWVLSRQVARMLTSHPAERPKVVSTYRKWRWVHLVLWLSCVGLVLAMAQWPQMVRSNLGLDGWILIDELLIMLPVVAPLVASWWMFQRVESLLRPSSASPCRYVLFQVRTQLGLALVPLMCMITVHDSVRWLAPDFLESEWSWVMLLLPMVLMLAFFPLLLRRVWETSPLPAGPLRTRLEEAAQRFRLPVRDILVWHTNGTMVNAAVSGILPRFRYVFLSDALLRHMDDAEIEAVFGHEVGHIRHHHVALRGLVLLAPTSLWGIAGSVWPQANEVLASLQSEWWMAAVGSLLGLAAIGGYIAAVFGFCSRRFERQADLFGCRVASAAWQEENTQSIAAPEVRTGDAPAADRLGALQLAPLAFAADGMEAGSGQALATLPHTAAIARPLSVARHQGLEVHHTDGLNAPGIATFISALEKLCDLNGVNRHSPSWQHSSIALRVAFLEQVLDDPSSEQTLDRQVRLLGWSLLAVMLLGLVIPWFAGSMVAPPL